MKPKSRIQSAHRSSVPSYILACLSILSSATITGILAFFLSLLLHESLSVPWMIILLITTSSVTLVATIIMSFLSSPSVRGVLRILLAILWVVTTTLLGNELSAHLAVRCPSAASYGHDLMLICQLYKAVFALTLVCAVCTLILVALDIKTWRDTRTMGRYIAVEGNTGGMDDMRRDQGTGEGGLKSSGMFGKVLKMRTGRREEKAVEEDERNIMMRPMGMDHMDGNSYKYNKEEGRLALPSPSSSSSPAPSHEWRQRQHPLMEQETRYDPGSRML